MLIQWASAFQKPLSSPPRMYLWSIWDWCLPVVRRHPNQFSFFQKAKFKRAFVSNGNPGSKIWPRGPRMCCFPMPDWASQDSTSLWGQIDPRFWLTQVFCICVWGLISALFLLYQQNSLLKTLLDIACTIIDREAREIMHLVYVASICLSVCLSVCLCSALPSAAKNNKSYYQSEVFVCNQGAYTDNSAYAVDRRFNCLTTGLGFVLIWHPGRKKGKSAGFLSHLPVCIHSITRDLPRFPFKLPGPCRIAYLFCLFSLKTSRFQSELYLSSESLPHKLLFTSHLF